MYLRVADNLLSTIRRGSYERRQILPLIFRLVNRKQYGLRKRLSGQFKSREYGEIPKDLGFVRARFSDMSVVEEVVRDINETVNVGQDGKIVAIKWVSLKLLIFGL